MAKFSGVVSTLGITPALFSAAASTAVSVGVNQVFQGAAGQSFIGQAGQVVVGNLATNIVNIGLSSVLGSSIQSASGLSLTSGSNFLAATITPLVTSTLASGINQTIDKTLQAAGPFQPLLSQITTSLVGKGVAGLNNLLGNGGNASPAGSTGTKAFPGAGNEPGAEYSGGGAYTLGTNGKDVVFSIRPANDGPQSEGVELSQSGVFSPTTIPYDVLASMSYGDVGINTTVDALKLASMTGTATVGAPAPPNQLPPQR